MCLFCLSASLMPKVLLEQGDPQSRVFLITQGSVSRLRYLNEQLHQVETVGGENHRYFCIFVLSIFQKSVDLQFVLVCLVTLGQLQRYMS